MVASAMSNAQWESWFSHRFFVISFVHMQSPMKFLNLFIYAVNLGFCFAFFFSLAHSRDCLRVAQQLQQLHGSSYTRTLPIHYRIEQITFPTITNTIPLFLFCLDFFFFFWLCHSFSRRTIDILHTYGLHKNAHSPLHRIEEVNQKKSVYQLTRSTTKHQRKKVYRRKQT